MTGRRPAAMAAYGVLGLFLLGEVAAIFIRTGHPVFFTLDDPYIHLALAENIAHGVYGINPAEYASPASSILYPFLLLPFAAIGLGDWEALALNLAASIGILAVWRQLFVRFGFEGDNWETNIGALLATLAVNGVALPFTGMEHTLHVFCTLAVTSAIVDVAEGNPTPRFLIPVALAGALLRYEGGAVAGAAALVLIWSGRWRQAALLVALVAIFYAGFSFFLHGLGLPFLPSSVLAKSDSASTVAQDVGIAAIARSLLSHLAENMSTVHVVMLIVAALSGAVIYRRRQESEHESRLKLGFFGLAVLAVHIVAFRSGWFFRYEPYAVAVLLACLGYALFSGLAVNGASLTGKVKWTWVGGFVSLILFASFYGIAISQTPMAARNIFEQQYQMHRFAVDFWRAPVAVNDLGWVAYRNPDYVLDLRGLGLDDARRAFARKDTKWMEQAVSSRHVGLAMIYKEWFKGFLPPSWTELARLHMESEQITPASDTVSFYLLDPALRPKAETALKDFAATLPNGATLDTDLKTVPDEASDD